MSAALKSPEGVLDNPVFEGMEGDRHQPRSGRQTPGQHPDKMIESIQLMVDPYAQGLKGARCRIDPLASASAKRASDNGRQTPRRGDCFLVPGSDDRSGNTSCKSLLSIGIDQIRQLLLTRRGNEICRSLTLALIHAHIQRLVAQEAEPSAWTLELKRRHAEVSEGTVDRHQSTFVEHRVKRTIVGVHQFHSSGPSCKHRACARERSSVAVQTDHARGPGFKQCPRMSTQTNGAVQVDTASCWLEVVHDLVDQNRNVTAQIPNSASARASSSAYGSR